MRLFTALDLPPEIATRLDQLIARLKPAARINWSPPANLHVTTKFIGEWPEERLDELKTALAVHPLAPADRRQYRTVWVSFPTRNRRAISGAALTRPASPNWQPIPMPPRPLLGIANEKRAYSPHLTLARIKERLDLRPLHHRISEEALDFGRFEVGAFFLYRSQLKPTGSVYTKLAEFPLTHT